MATLDVGQSTANALYQQAVAGTFTMEVGVAKKCADHFHTFADSLDPSIKKSAAVSRLDGFGGFKSADELKSGFQDKGAALTQALQGMQEAALRMAAAYLHAGGQLEEADEMNRKAIAAQSAGLDQ